MTQPFVHEREYPVGSKIFLENDVSDDLFIILEGQIELLKTDSDGTVQRIEVLEPPRVFGELEFILERPRAYSAKALTDVRVRMIPSRVFAELFTTDLGQIVRPVFQSWSQQLRTALLQEQDSGPMTVTLPEIPETKGQFTVSIHPQSFRAVEALNGLEQLLIERFPLYVGRFSRRRSDSIFHANNLYLIDQMPYAISRSHFALVLTDKGVEFQDRGSTLGSVVNGIIIGGTPEAQAKTLLHVGDNSLSLGNSQTGKLVFTLRVERS
jgi:CRP-like cAMP-binding protein